MRNDNAIDQEHLCGGTPDDEDYCPICGSDMDRVECWQCHGEGGFHDCGEDTCCCLDKGTIDVDCEECGGNGYYWECIALPHSEEQMAAYRAKAPE